MRIQVASDLHLEFLESRFPNYRVLEHADADVLVIAGDIHQHTRAIAAFKDWGVPVIYVHGNHEPYGANYEKVVNALRAASTGTRVHYLECDEYVYDEVRFLGCCLWTDYHLLSDSTIPAMREAEHCLNDHRMIRSNNGFFTPRDAARLHAKSRAWLEAKLDEPFSGATVVVTHHAPHPNSIHPRYSGNMLNAAFASNLSHLVEKADLWIHGHVHDNFDYEVNGTRVIANPRGYALNRLDAESPTQLVWENPYFDPSCIVEIT